MFLHRQNLLEASIHPSSATASVADHLHHPPPSFITNKLACVHLPSSSTLRWLESPFFNPRITFPFSSTLRSLSLVLHPSISNQPRFQTFPPLSIREAQKEGKGASTINPFGCHSFWWQSLNQARRYLFLPLVQRAEERPLTPARDSSAIPGKKLTHRGQRDNHVVIFGVILSVDWPVVEGVWLLASSSSKWPLFEILVSSMLIQVLFIEIQSRLLSYRLIRVLSAKI